MYQQFSWCPKQNLPTSSLSSWAAQPPFILLLHTTDTHGTHHLNLSLPTQPNHHVPPFPSKPTHHPWHEGMIEKSFILDVIYCSFHPLSPHLLGEIFCLWVSRSITIFHLAFSDSKRKRWLGSLNFKVEQLSLSNLCLNQTHCKCNYNYYYNCHHYCFEKTIEMMIKVTII